MTGRKLRWLTWLAVAALDLTSRAFAAGEPLTVARALALAREHAPALAAERAAAATALGERVTSGYLLPDEPVLEIEVGPRSSEGASTTSDRGIKLSQRLEIAGQRGRRQVLATHRIEAAAADYRAFERDYLAAVGNSYLEASASEERLALATRAVAWGEEADAAAALRHEAGDIALLDRNLAAVELARLEAERWRAERDAATARVDLDALLGAALEPGRERGPAVVSLEAAVLELEQWATPKPTANTGREELSAARARIGAEEAQVELLRAERVPDLVASIGHGLEDGNDRLTRFGLGFELPLFRRNRGEIESAAAALEQRRAALTLAEQQVARERARARLRSAAAASAASALSGPAMARLEQNLSLATESFEAGKIGLLELLFVRRSGLELYRLLVEARLERGQALIEARRSAGLAPIGE